MKVRAIFTVSLFVALLGMHSCAPKTQAPPKYPPNTTVASVWMKTDPIQCQLNPWEKDAPPAEAGTDKAKREEDLLRAYLLKAATVKVMAFSQKFSNENVCDACTCPRGDTIWIMVSGPDADILEELHGWKRAEGPGK